MHRVFRISNASSTGSFAGNTRLSTICMATGWKASSRKKGPKIDILVIVSLLESGWWIASCGGGALGPVGAATSFEMLSMLLVALI